MEDIFGSTAGLSDREVHDRQIASRRVTNQPSWPPVVRYARHDLPERFRLPMIVRSSVPRCWQISPAQLNDEA